jgi:hypothetical protein
MTPDQVISLAASVGACLAAIATFLTVWQIAKQRRASYRPELVLGGGEFEAAAGEHDFGLPQSWRHPAPKPMGDSVVIYSSGPVTFGLPLANVGLGAARNVSISWAFDIEHAAASVDAVAQQAEYQEFLTFNRGVLKMRSPIVASFWDNQKIEAIDYVLPASISGSELSLRLPNAYVLLVAAAVSLNFSSKIRELGGRPELLEPPPLSAVLTFDDIGGGKHQAAFDLDVSIRAADMNHFFGYVETKRRR